MPHISDEKIKELTDSLDEIEKSAYSVGRSRGEIQEEESVRSALSELGYKKPDTAEDTASEQDVEFEDLLSEIDDLKSDLNDIQKSGKRWRRQSWIWRLISFVLGLLSGTVATISL